MKMRNLFFILSVSVLTAAGSGCTFISQSNELPEKIKDVVEKINREEKVAAAGKKAPESKKIVTENKELKKQLQVVNEYILGRELLSAFLKDDGKKFVALLPARLRQEFDYKKFEATRKAVIASMGEPVSFRYVTALEMTAVTPHIWAVRFSRISRDEKEEYTSEMLFRVITGHLDGKPYIIGFNFF
ncbi:MAG: hypothetical protein IKC08_00245 [Lentisphaeria bacterium]|nr:hypothetical protein [Lentisphaeria bacterium]